MAVHCLSPFSSCWAQVRFLFINFYTFESLVAQRLKHLPEMQETQVRSLGREDPLEKENGNPFQYSCPENPMEGGAWYATVHGVTKSLTQLKQPNTQHMLVLSL